VPALDAIAAGKGHCEIEVGTTTKICDAVQRAVQFLCEPFVVVDRAYAKLGETRQLIRQNEVTSATTA